MKIGKYLFRIPHFDVNLYADVYIYQKGKDTYSLSIRFDKKEIIDKTRFKKTPVYITDYYWKDSYEHASFDYNTPVQYLYYKYTNGDLYRIERLLNSTGRKTCGILMTCNKKKLVQMLTNQYKEKRYSLHLRVDKSKRYIKDKFVIPDNKQSYLIALAL